MVAATDPIAVIATFKQLGTSRRPSMLVEGESLLNDGTAKIVGATSRSCGSTIISGGTDTMSTPAF
jgi:hypothetical protein